MAGEILIGGHVIGEGHPCFVVAEHGISWNGDMEVARQMIDLAADAGADAYKTQKRDVENYWTAEEMAAPRPGPWGPSFGSLKRLLEMSPAQCREVRDRCVTKGITWSASPWDVASVAVLAELDVQWVKIASASITDEALVKSCGDLGVPVVMSTGMSDTAQIDRAVEWIASTRAPGLALLHTCSTYPAAIADLHLERLSWLRSRYPGCVIGYSGHETGVLPSVEAVRLGASIIERHVTLDRTMWGSDQAASLEPTGLRILVRAIRELEKFDDDTRRDPFSAVDAVTIAEVAEVLRKGARNREVASTSRGTGGPRHVLPVEEPVRKKLRRVG